jgi:Actin
MAFYTNSDSVNAVVADVGSYATKIGFAGEDYPRSYFRSVRCCVCVCVVQTESGAFMLLAVCCF